jgi:hypothetical protein
MTEKKKQKISGLIIFMILGVAALLAGGLFWRPLFYIAIVTYFAGILVVAFRKPRKKR